jgi:hypothetical protein
MLDLNRARVTGPANATVPEKKAVNLLIEEVQARTQIRWPMGNTQTGNGPEILVEKHTGGPAEGYHIRVEGQRVIISGNDSRGILFGIGGLLRAMHMRKGSVMLDADFAVTTAPRYPLRGHQLGYRPKVNTYDAWKPAQFEQYIRELAVFGSNTIDLIPPRSDDADDSPHFTLSKIEMMVEMSRICDEYGLDVSIWYPAMSDDYADPKTVESELKEWGDVFRRLPRIDAVFIPGGDPGHMSPRVLIPWAEKVAKVLHQYHPRAQVWTSTQNFTQDWVDEFCSILQKQQPAWLDGVVFAPGTRITVEQLRARIPKRYPIRHYPDITHSRGALYPVPDWDMAYAITEGREVINPRPMDEALIFRASQPLTIGFITYSEGVNDDVNKIVWSELGWDPEKPVPDILRDYSRYFIGDSYGDSFAQALLALERNWHGPLLTNGGVAVTLEQFQTLERTVPPQVLQNWRFQMALYRAYYDAYEQRRLLHETAAEAAALEKLGTAPVLGTVVAMRQAEEILDNAVPGTAAVEWRNRIYALAEALFQSIRMQLSVGKYKAIAIERGATLDSLDTPLNNRLWMEARFAEIRVMSNEADRLAGLDQIINWNNPGPGGFYDDLGNPRMQPHLVRPEVYASDPGYFVNPATTFSVDATERDSWRTFATALYDAPLKMHYDGLDPAAHYKLRVTYAKREPRNQQIRLLANDRIEIHPLIQKLDVMKPMEFKIPQQATSGGQLTLTWYRTPGLGYGRDSEVAEVWLIRE